VPHCTECGKEVADETRFCDNCGASLKSAQSAADGIQNTLPVNQKISERQDLLGLVSAGVILILVGITYQRYPIDLTVIRDYIQNMASSGIFVRPPQVLFDPMIFFLYAVGLWGIVLTVLRIVVDRNVGKAAQDFCGCLFAFFCIFLLTNYATGVFTERVLAAYFVVAIGVLIVANAVVTILSPKHK